MFKVLNMICKSSKAAKVFEVFKSTSCFFVTFMFVRFETV